MNLYEPFKWRLLILDDDKRRLETTVSYLKGYGFDVTLLHDPSKFHEDFLTLSQGDIAFIDMKWLCFPKRESYFRKFPVSTALSELARTEPDSLISEWVETVWDWVKGGSDSRPKDSHGFPAKIIPLNEIGVWFGAMLSWIAPKCTILFFSSDQEAVNQEFAPALTLFRERPFYVFNKASTQPGTEIVPVDFLFHLATKQRTFLMRREVRLWFIKDVLLRALGNKEPEKGQVGVPFAESVNDLCGGIAGGVERQSLEARYFFPGFESYSNQKDRITYLRQFLEDPILSREEYIALWQFVHDAKYYPQEPARLPLMIDSLEAAGIWGQESANRLRSHRDSRPPSDQVSDDKNWTISRALVEAVMKNAVDYLKSLCGRLGDQATFADSIILAEDRPIAPVRGAVFQPYGSKKSFPGIRILRFPPSWIGSILHPLKDNAVKCECSWMVRITADAESLRVLFASDWDSNSKFDRNSFWECAASSSGDDGRGLPLAVPRILETNPDQCLIKTGEETFDIWGDTVAGFSPLGTESFDFAIEVSYRFYKTSKH